MALPCVLFSSSADSFKPQEFVKQILKVSELPQPTIVSERIESYEWSFETKYYSATVHLCTTEMRTIGDEDFAESVQAFIHYFDPNVLHCKVVDIVEIIGTHFLKQSSFELAKAWLPYLDHIKPDILMLVCNTSRNSDVIKRKVALEWCIQNAFELVELNPELDSDDEDDDFPETTGVARIIQALHAHTWPNLCVKDTVTVQSPYLRQMMKEQHILNKELHSVGNTVSSQHSTESCQALSTSDTKDDASSSAYVCSMSSGDTAASQPAQMRHSTDSTSSCAGPENTESLNKVGSDLENVLFSDDIDWKSLLADSEAVDSDASSSGSHVDVDNFEKLFMKLKVMKDKAEGLPPEERKKYAEKVAICFWKAIGGDEDEIDGLNDDFQ